MPQKHPNQDRAFDDLSSRFKRNIYNTLKGKLRLAVLKRDFEQLGELTDKAVLDTGAGQGQFGLWVAERGAKVTLTDISHEMLTEAQQAASDLSLLHKPVFICADLWQLPAGITTQGYDLVMNHAVLEWLEEPLTAISHLNAQVKPGGYLSLLFYNIHGLIYKNLLRANYQKVVKKDFRGQRGSLTPLNPLEPQHVIEHAAKLGLETVCHSGVRVFHDYLLDREKQSVDVETAIALELELSQQEPYRGLGRYVHLLLKKPDV